MMPLRRALCLASGAMLLGALSACSTPSRQLQSNNDAGYWSGRLSVQVHDTPPQTNSGSFELSGNAEQGELLLLTPLGNIVARVHWDASSASITQGSQTRQADSLDALTQELLGAQLPIAALFDWLSNIATQAQGWSANLAARDQGLITAQRSSPLPAASLRIVLDQ